MRKKLRYAAFAFVGLIVLIVALSLAGNSTTGRTHAISGTKTAQGAQNASQPAPDVPTPSPTPGAVARVWFVVTGEGQPSITYGSDSDNLSPPNGNLGLEGDGNALPFKAWVPFNGNALYYSLNAQLEGSGHITCKIIVTGAGDNPTTVATGHASGGYNICDAQAAPDNPQGTSWNQE